MTDLELLAEPIDDLFKHLHPELISLTPDELGWNPAPQVNSIGVTLWHMVWQKNCWLSLPQSV
jgi:hypothetical protein